MRQSEYVHTEAGLEEGKKGSFSGRMRRREERKTTTALILSLSLSLPPLEYGGEHHGEGRRLLISGGREGKGGNYWKRGRKFALNPCAILQFQPPKCLHFVFFYLDE